MAYEKVLIEFFTQAACPESFLADFFSQRANMESGLMTVLVLPDHRVFIEALQKSSDRTGAQKIRASKGVWLSVGDVVLLAVAVRKSAGTELTDKEPGAAAPGLAFFHIPDQKKRKKRSRHVALRFFVMLQEFFSLVWKRARCPEGIA